VKPSSTTYRVIADYDYYADAIDKLWSETDIPKFPTVHPQIVAERDGKVIGFVARRHDKQGIIIEPMIAPTGIVWLRLVEAMERMLAAAGVRSYYFRLEPHRVKYQKMLLKHNYLAEEVGYQDGFYWFKREMVA